ncbi:MAG: patatin-like phospholipase family protein, partial [Burkholderiales bacterium]|nr:patatin-like phospholipase family protein [Burkholderiales bacterium]
ARVTQEIRELLQAFIGGHEAEIISHPSQRLHVLAVRGRGRLQAPQSELSTKLGFASAALANLGARKLLARHMTRVVIGDSRDTLDWMPNHFDAFQTDFAALSAENLLPSLLASGTLPLIMEPVRQIAGTPAGTYWDGGMIDYHLHFPYAQLQDRHGAGLVLYPHFSDHIIPGWLDKSLPWRRANKGAHSNWLDNLIMLSPSASFIQSLPRAKLPDRTDFFHYGIDHEARIRDWKLAISASEKLAVAFAAFVAKPDMAIVKPLNF